VSRRGTFALLAALLLTASLQCRRAEGVSEDPVEQEAEDALVAYLRIDTTNPPGNETSGAVYLRDLLTKEGIEARLVGADSKRQGVYARLRSGTNAKALLLLSHIDVVPADPAQWRNPPFEGKREGGYIWGRGAIDAKSLTIAHLMAFVNLRRTGAKLTRDVVFLATPDEELGGLEGVRELLERDPQLFAGVGFALNEGGANDTAVDRVLVWGVEVQQKQPLWLRVVAEGRGGHGAAVERGAPSKLVRALAAIDGIETPWRLTEDVARSAAAARAVRKDARAGVLGLIREPLDIPAIERELPGYRALLRDTITITRIRAGSAINSVPTQASAEVDIRLLPGTNPQSMLDEVRRVVGEEAKVEVLLSSEPIPGSPASGELWEAVRDAMLRNSPQSPVVPLIIGGTTDSRHLRQAGVTAYGVSPFKINYYDAPGVHGNDERIRARFFAEGVRLMRAIVRDFCVAGPSKA
jgi:acetylornithine deacetylase/succinyl-diaminopimelate desuccinylase-like protein